MTWLTPPPALTSPGSASGRNNKSGVVWRPESRRWQASIMFKGTRHNLGKYERFDDAAEARREAEALYYGSFLADFDANQAMTEPA